MVPEHTHCTQTAASVRKHLPGNGGRVGQGKGWRGLRSQGDATLNTVFKEALAHGLQQAKAAIVATGLHMACKGLQVGEFEGIAVRVWQKAQRGRGRQLNLRWQRPAGRAVAAVD
jgi:hypothetical protein